MTARFAGEQELQTLLEKNYRSFPTELGAFYVPGNATFLKDTVNIGMEKFFTKIAITLSGIEVIERPK